MTLVVSDLLSGCWSCFYAGRQLGGRETDRPGYRQGAGCSGGPRSDPKGNETHTEPNNNYLTIINSSIAFECHSTLYLHFAIKGYIKE